MNSLPWRSKTSYLCRTHCRCNFNTALHTAPHTALPASHQTWTPVFSSPSFYSPDLSWHSSDTSTGRVLPQQKRFGIDLVGVRAAPSHCPSLLASSCGQKRSRNPSTLSAKLKSFIHISCFFHDLLKVPRVCFSLQESDLVINQQLSISTFWMHFRVVGSD